jgi:hypothetical protein
MSLHPLARQLSSQVTADLLGLTLIARQPRLVVFGSSSKRTDPSDDIRIGLDVTTSQGLFGSQRDNSRRSAGGRLYDALSD